MTNDELEAQCVLEKQSRAAIKAWCDDPSVQLEYCHKTYMDWRALIVINPVFSFNNYHYRIATPKKWYRVGKFNSGSLCFAESDIEETNLETTTIFSHWLDERKYYDN